MKKVFLAAVLAVSSLAASAQIWVGGSLGLGISEPEEGESTTAIAIAPEVGYTLNEKWDVAVAVNFDFASCDGETANAGLGYGTGDFEPDYMYVGFRPGIKLAVNDNLGFVAKLGFIGYESVEDVESNYGINVGGSDLSFGMYWAF